MLWLQVRRWMFFHTTTLSLMDALDALANAAQAALTTQPQLNVPWWKFWGSSSSSSSKQGSGEQQYQQEAAPTKSAADVEVGLSSVAEDKQQQQQQSEKSSSIELSSQPSPAVLGSLVSLRPGSQDAVAAVDAAAAGLVLPQQQAPSPSPQHALPAAAPATQQHAAAACQQLPPAVAGSGGVKASLVKHTAWVKPWLPLALNLEQYKNLRTVFTQDVPRALSSKQGD